MGIWKFSRYVYFVTEVMNSYISCLKKNLMFFRTSFRQKLKSTQSKAYITRKIRWLEYLKALNDGSIMFKWRPTGDNQQLALRSEGFMREHLNSFWKLENLFQTSCSIEWKTIWLESDETILPWTPQKCSSPRTYPNQV